MGEGKWKQLKTWCSSTTEMIHRETKATQMQKFERLQAKQHLVPQLDKDKLVKNLSSRNITKKEKDVLALGLNLLSHPDRSLQPQSQQPLNWTRKQPNNSDTG